MRWVIALVLPVPAPASTQTGPRQASATSRCSGSSAASRSSASTCLWCRMREGAERKSCCTAPETPQNEAVGSATTRRPSVPLTMYTTTWCGFCKNLKRQLGKAGVEVNEVDIELDPEAAKFVEGVNGGNQTVPTLLFADGSTLCNPSAAQVQKKLAELGAAQAG